MNYLVSIIIPVYNVELYISKCLDSVVKQTYNNLEIIVVDDGSNDSSLDIIKYYQLSDQRIKVYSKTNGGLSSARNYGLDNCHGQYVFFLDSDDYIKDYTIELLLNNIIDNNCDIAVCDLIYVYNEIESISSGGDFVIDNINTNSDLILINNSACNKLYNYNLFNDIRFIDGLWYEDLATIPIVICKAKNIIKVNDALYYYMQRDGSISHTISYKTFDIYKAIYNISINTVININRLYIIHGLYLTTIRIKNSNNSDKLDYLKENMLLMNKYYPNYYQDEYLKTFSLKSRIIFILLKYKFYKLVLLLYNK